MRQVTFAVYPAGMTNLTLKEKKGSIEVTQILGDHLAEARVLDDQPSNPIVPGDKIHTVLWSPGQQRHFALAGFFDIDGDGRSDLQTVMDLIKANGGVVDAYIADSGKDKNKQQGEITVNTNYLILGEAPTEKGDPGQLAAFTKMLRDAAQLRIPTMQFGDMLQGMGWRNLSPVVRYGRGINPNDFRAKPDEGGQRKSTGSHDRRLPETRAARDADPLQRLSAVLSSFCCEGRCMLTLAVGMSISREPHMLRQAWAWHRFPGLSATETT